MAVEKDDEYYNKQKPMWESSGVHLTRVQSMQEAAERVVKESYWIIGINADNINYLPQLSILRDMADASIHVVTTHYTIAAHEEALEHGADVYAEWRENIEHNIRRALALSKRIHKRQRLIKCFSEPLSCGDIILYPGYRQVFCLDTEVMLRKMEFDLLHYLMENYGLVLRHEQIIEQLWGDSYNELEHGALRNQIYRLRERFETVAVNLPVETVVGVGYRLKPWKPLAKSDAIQYNIIK